MASSTCDDGRETTGRGNAASKNTSGASYAASADIGTKLVVVQPGQRRTSLEDRINAMSMSLPPSSGRSSPAPGGRSSPAPAERASPLLASLATVGSGGGRASPAAGGTAKIRTRSRSPSPGPGRGGTSSDVENGYGGDVEHYSGVDENATTEDGEVVTSGTVASQEEAVTTDSLRRRSGDTAGGSGIGTAQHAHVVALIAGNSIAGKRITWSDEHGMALVEVFYSDKLHYSVPFDDGMGHSCCRVS